MKIFLLKLVVIWRRFRGAAPRHSDPSRQCLAQLEALMRRANPDAAWDERANWMIDVAEWLRHEPTPVADDDHHRRGRYQRLHLLLDWLDAHRDVRRMVQSALRKTLREAVGPELFCATGLPHEAALFGEFGGHLAKLSERPDLSALFTAMFPDAAGARWMFGLDHKLLSRIWRLCADESIAHRYRQQIDEALIYLASMVVSIGVSLDFRQRLEPCMPLQATPFMALRREVERYLLSPMGDAVALRSVRMLIAVCQAQTERIYAHLDEHGVSVGLVYRVERMRALLARMTRLIDLRSTPADEAIGVKVQALLIDLADAHHRHSSMKGLVSRSFSLFARKTIERHAHHGEHYIAHDRQQYGTVLKSACRGGLFAVIAVLGKMGLAGGGRFFEGILASLNYGASFIVISAFGGTLAARQAAATAPALAARMQAPDTDEGIRRLVAECAALLRVQTAATIGNLLTVMPAMLGISLAVLWISGAPLLRPESAHENLHALSATGSTPLFAAATGVLLWLSGMVAGFADNWFALRKLRDGLAHQRRLVATLGPVRAQRFASWIERHMAGIAGNLSLALLFGFVPALAQFFGLPFDVRHVTLSAGTLAGAASSLGWQALTLPQFWSAAAGVLLTATLNIGVAFACALTLAMRAREVPGRVRRCVFRSLFKRLVTAPHAFLLPPRHSASVTVLPVRPTASREEHKAGRERTG